MIRLFFSIVATPDPDNSIEKPAGTTLRDDRLTGHYAERITMTAGTGGMWNFGQFSKPVNSNLLSFIDESQFFTGDKITIDICEG